MFSFVDEDHKETEEECEELVRRINFVTSEEGTLFDVDRRSLFDFVSQSETKQRSEGILFYSSPLPFGRSKNAAIPSDCCWFSCFASCFRLYDSLQDLVPVYLSSL